jgi:hypothetical protein
MSIQNTQPLLSYVTVSSPSFEPVEAKELALRVRGRLIAVA